MQLHIGSVTGLTFLKYIQYKIIYQIRCTVNKQEQCQFKDSSGSNILFVCQTAGLNSEFPKALLHRGSLGFSLFSSKF
jgi:hypothetical protein